MVNLWNNSLVRLWTRELRGWEKDSALLLGQIIQDVHLSTVCDKLLWQGNKAQWKTKDAYDLIESGSLIQGPWELIWKIKIPNRVKIFLWKICHEILPVKSFLAKRIPNISTRCPLCKFEEEDIIHLLWECSQSKLVWHQIFSWWSLPGGFLLGKKKICMSYYHARWLSYRGKLDIQWLLYLFGIYGKL